MRSRNAGCDNIIHFECLHLYPMCKVAAVRFVSDDNDVITCSAYLSHSPTKSSNKLIREYNA